VCTHPLSGKYIIFVYLISELYTVVNLILKKMSNIGATRCQILRLNAPKSISAGAPPHTPLGSAAGGAYSAPPDLLAVFKGAYF